MNDLSVVIALHNAEPWIGAAIMSVLQQADGLLEIIVVDDGSTDNGPDVARAFGGPVRVLEQDNAGPSAARNRGLFAAQGDLVGFLDSDDLWMAGIPDPRRAVLEDPEVDIVTGRVQPVVGNPPRPFRHSMSGMLTGAMLARRQILLEHGGYDETLRRGEDLDLVLRLREGGARIVAIDDVTCWYRQRPGSLSKADRAGTDRDVLAVIRASMKRRGVA